MSGIKDGHPHPYLLKSLLDPTPGSTRMRVWHYHDRADCVSCLVAKAEESGSYHFIRSIYIDAVEHELDIEKCPDFIDYSELLPPEVTILDF